MNQQMKKSLVKDGGIDKMSVLEIQPFEVPLEVWRTIFDTMPIDEKFQCSQVIIEFGEFYQDLLKNYSKYACHFINGRVERAARRWITSSYFDDSVNDMKYTTFSCSIFHSQHLIKDIEKGYPTGTFPCAEVKFINEVDDSNDPNYDEYHTYLRAFTDFPINLEVLNLRLPTGRYNIYYKIWGLCKVSFPAYFHKVNIKHKLSHLKNEVGFIDHRKHLDRKPGRIIPSWQWVPVYKDTKSGELLTVNVNYEKGDRTFD